MVARFSSSSPDSSLQNHSKCEIESFTLECHELFVVFDLREIQIFEKMFRVTG